MELIISIIAIYGLAFLIKESDGPWDIISWFRGKLFTNKFIGVFAFKLLECYFCLGCWCGLGIYLLTQPWNIGQAFIWFLAGGVISLSFNKLLNH